MFRDLSNKSSVFNAGDATLQFRVPKVKTDNVASPTGSKKAAPAAASIPGRRPMLGGDEVAPAPIPAPAPAMPFAPIRASVDVLPAKEDPVHQPPSQAREASSRTKMEQKRNKYMLIFLQRTVVNCPCFGARDCLFSAERLGSPECAMLQEEIEVRRPRRKSLAPPRFGDYAGDDEIEKALREVAAEGATVHGAATAKKPLVHAKKHGG